ncbi:MAG TPA: glycosyl transferase group 1, partial [Verrucomicrobiales bacterium]|nr:glycosyl transferase group 1 [Verrucomicrobiales bacterium]
MRVTHVITRLVVGGAQENTIATVLGLRARHGVDARLVSGPTIGPEGTLEDRVRQEPGVLTLAPNLIRAVHPLRDWLALGWLTREFRATRPDIVHTHSGKAGVLGRLAAKRAGVPLIIHTIHGPSFGGFQGPVANSVFTWAERRAARVTDHFIAVSQAMIDQYLTAGIGRPDQYSLIYSGFDLKPYSESVNDPELRAKLGFGPKD